MLILKNDDIELRVSNKKTIACFVNQKYCKKALSNRKKSWKY